MEQRGLSYYYASQLLKRLRVAPFSGPSMPVLLPPSLRRRPRRLPSPVWFVQAATPCAQPAITYSRVGMWRVILADTFPQTPLRTGLDTFVSSGSPELKCFERVTVSLYVLLHGTSHTPPAFFFASQSSSSPRWVSPSVRANGFSGQPVSEHDALHNFPVSRRFHIRWLAAFEQGQYVN